MTAKKKAVGSTKSVTLAYDYEDGRADETVDLPTAVANDLLFRGRARLPKTTAKKAAETSASPAAPKE